MCEGQTGDPDLAPEGGPWVGVRRKANDCAELVLADQGCRETVISNAAAVMC